MNTSTLVKAGLSTVLVVLSAFYLNYFLQKSRKKPIQTVALTPKKAFPPKQLDLASLPEEILLHILSFSSESDLFRASQVCKRWYNIIQTEDNLWRTIFANRWPYKKLIPDGRLSWRETYLKTSRAEGVRLNFRPYKYIMSIMMPTSPDVEIDEEDTNWQKRFIKEVSTSNIVLQQNEILTTDGVVLGKYRFIRVDDVAKKFVGAPWMQRFHVNDKVNRSEIPICPFTGNVAGYINFDFYPANSKNRTADEIEEIVDAIKEAIHTFTYEGKGVLARSDTDEYALAVHLVEYPLVNAFSKYGVSDGDALLDCDKDSAYIQSMLAESKAILKKANKQSQTSYVKTTTHNPLRLEVYKDEDLYDLKIKIWTYNFDIVRNPRLFQL